MTLHPEARAFLAVSAGAPELDTRSPAENRAAQEATRHLMGTRNPVAEVEDLVIAGVPVRIYRPAEAAADAPVFLYFHGGGWVLGDLETADSTVRDIARASGVVCISVDYRRAPEHRFPAALEDCLAVTRAVLGGTSGLAVDQTRVAVGGDSAGGNIAAVIARELRTQISFQVLIYPVLDLSGFDTDSHRRYAEGHFLTRRRLSYFYEAYAGDHDRKDPRLSPLHARDLSGLPPALMISAECDPLRDEATAYAEALSAAGTGVSAVCFRGQVHPFVQMSTLISDALVARRLIGGELKVRLRPKEQH